MLPKHNGSATPYKFATLHDRTVPSAPRVVGRAGAGLEDAAWAKNPDVAATGRSGELRTAEVLHRFLLADNNGPSILHDIILPVRQMRANIDHVVVSGRDVWLLDTKVWAPGTYWTVLGHTRRGLRRIPWADKKTSLMAVQSISGFLAANNVRAKVHRPVLVVWPSNANKEPNITWYHANGARAIPAAKLARFCTRMRKPAAPEIVHVLARLATEKTAFMGDAVLARPSPTSLAPAEWLGDGLPPDDDAPDWP
jgi:hypothetical protein